jgi:signal peptidase I
MRLLRSAERAFAIVGLAMVGYHGAFDLTRLTSGSMQPTLRGDRDAGDLLLSETLTGRWRAPRRFEVVTFRNDEGLLVAKRVFGLPGEQIALRDGGFVVDGTPLALPPSLRTRRYYAYGNLTRGATIACGTGYYVLGDDSQDSQDSRFEGPIERARLLGRAWLIVSPVARLGWVR